MHGYSSDLDDNNGIWATNFKVNKKDIKPTDIFNIILKKLNLS